MAILLEIPFTIIVAQPSLSDEIGQDWSQLVLFKSLMFCINCDN